MKDWEKENGQKIYDILFSYGMPLAGITESVNILLKDRKSEIKKAFMEYLKTYYNNNETVKELYIEQFLKSRGV